MTLIDLTGQRFASWTVLRRYESPSLKPQWWCRCSCGTERAVAGSSLRQGLSTSCGCANRAKLFRHGHTWEGGRTPEYAAWADAITRCENQRNRAYRRYGARGIVVCRAWRDSFAAFLRDMGPRPSPAHSLDRKDNDGPYAPDNCRWATKPQQQNNRSITRRISWDGRTQTIGEWAAELGISPDAIETRLRRGWATNDVLAVRRRKDVA